jgi:ABC-2 type transport system permease protein
MRTWLARLLSPRMRALVWKELHQIKRDKRIMMSLILPPLLQLMLFGTVMNPDVANVQIGIVDDSQSPESRDLVAALSQSGSFTLRALYRSANALGNDLSQGTIDAGVVIPSDFARDLQRGRPTTIQVLLNAMNANTAAISQGYVQGVVQNYNQVAHADTVQVAVQQLAGSGPARGGRALLYPALLYNPGGVTTWFIVTGLFGILLIMRSRPRSSC